MALEPACNVTNPANVCIPLGLRETRVRKDVANRVAVEVLDLLSTTLKLLEYARRNGALPRPGKTGEPDNRRPRLLLPDPDPVPHPLVKPEKSDLRDELQPTHRQRQSDAAGEKEN